MTQKYRIFSSTSHLRRLRRGDKTPCRPAAGPPPRIQRWGTCLARQSSSFRCPHPGRRQRVAINTFTGRQTKAWFWPGIPLTLRFSGPKPRAASPRSSRRGGSKAPTRALQPRWGQHLCVPRPTALSTAPSWTVIWRRRHSTLTAVLRMSPEGGGPVYEREDEC